MKFPNYPERRYEIAYPTSGARSRLWRLPVNSKFSPPLISSLQISTDVISLEEKQMECIWRITCFEEDVLVVFPTGFDKRHDSKNDKIASPHWVVVVSLLEYKRKHQVEDLKNTRWRIESVLSLRDFFKESTWWLMRKNCFFFFLFFFFFLSPVSTAGRKSGPTLLITSDKIKDVDVCRFSVSG